MRAALYLLVSNQDHIPDPHLHKLRQTATERGFVVVREYADRVSGSKVKRPALDQLLAAARKRNFDVVMVESLSDLAPSVQKCISVLEQLNQLGIGFVSCRPEIDTTGELGQGIAATIRALSALNRLLRTDNVKRGMRLAKQNGVHIGRTPLPVNRTAIVEDRLSGLSLTTVGRRHGVSRAMVCRLVKLANGQANRLPLCTGEPLSLGVSA